MTHGCDVLIAGAGIIGLTLGRELLHRGVKDIVIVEKEPAAGLHASGRNSGVLHAGIYYIPDSLKARFCREGNHRMKAYCRQKGLPLKECGKVIVTTTEEEEIQLEELKARADSNGVLCRLIDSHELKELEPHAQTLRRAIYSPETACIDPVAVVHSLTEDLQESGVRILYSTPYDRKTCKIQHQFFINAAGAYADQICHSFGLGSNYRLLPFKGTYKKVIRDVVGGNIYPVPDLRNPFLGVHLSRNIHGEIYAGPTAIPAFSRENYSFLQDWDGETPSIVFRDLLLFFGNDIFRETAAKEIRKYIPQKFFQDVKKLVPSLTPLDLQDCNKRGIRPQLIDWKTKQLVMDFVVLQEEKSLHILNAVSPAFTCSMAFASYLADCMHHR